MSCHVVSCRVVSCLVMSCHVMSYETLPHDITSYTSDCNTPYQLMAHHRLCTMPCILKSCQLVACHVTAFDAVARQQGPCTVKSCQGLLEHGKLQSDGPLHSSPGLVKSYHEQPILQHSAQYGYPWNCTQPIGILQALHAMRVMDNGMLKWFMKLAAMPA